MKRTYNPDVAPLREKEYAKLDSQLLEAIAETMEILSDQDIPVSPKMLDLLEQRKGIKEKFKKT